jgi:hypothetical protein
MNEDGPRSPRSSPLFGLRDFALGCGIVLVIVLILAVPVLKDTRDSARSAVCYKQGNVLHSAISVYAADYDERLPPASQWEDLILPGRLRLSPQDVGCPSRPRAVGPHAFNKALDRQFRAKVNDQAPMLFESNSGERNHSDLLESFARPHKGKGWVVLGGGMVKSYIAPPHAKLGQQ